MAYTLKGIGNVQLDRRRPRKALEAFTRAYTIANAHLGSDDERVADFLGHMAGAEAAWLN